MAEGGGLTSINHGSDTDYEYTCTPCGEDDIREEAVKYCPACQEYLCTTCTRHHGRQKITRSHTLLKCDVSMKAPEVTMVTKCRYHPDRDIEMYCEEHDMVYCTMCIATEHRSCRGISSLKEIDISSNQLNEIKSLKTDYSNMQTRLQDTERRTQTNIDSVEEQKRDIISQIAEIERNFVEHIRKLKQEALETLGTEYTEVKENLETNISQIRKAKVEIEQIRNQIQAVDILDKGQQFVQIKLIKQTVNDAMKIIEENEAKGYQNLSFIENKELQSSIKTSTSLGRVEKVIESNNSMSSKVYKLPDGTIILASKNARIKRFDVNYNIKEYFDVGGYPRGICCTGNTEVAVKQFNKVQIISVGSSLYKLRDISINDSYNWGIAYYAGELWVSSGGDVDVYSMSGTLLKTVHKGVNGQKIFKSTTQRMTVSGDTVIVTDSSDGAVCLRRDGTVIRELRDDRLTYTSSVCVSNEGTVFIAGHNSSNVVMFDKAGKCLGELLDKEGWLKCPISMCYDSKNKCVLVCNDNSYTPTVLNISH